MNIARQLITIATMLVSVHTAIGVLLHDTSIDKAFTASWEYVYYDKSDTDEAKMPETNPHTHPEHAQVSHILKNGSSQPRTTPRDNDRKRLRQKYAARGQHTFDGYRLIVGDTA